MSPLPKFTFVRAIGNKIIEVKNGPFTGKFLKHISKQGPVYIRSNTNLCEDITKQVQNKKSDNEESVSGEDQSLVLQSAYSAYLDSMEKDMKDEQEESTYRKCHSCIIEDIPEAE